MTSIASQGGMVDKNAPRACEGRSIAELTRITVVERAAHSPNDVAVAERELRARAHEERQRVFDLRLMRQLNHEKYVTKTRKIARSEAAVGLLACCPTAFLLAFVLPAHGGIRPPLTLDTFIRWLAFVVCGAYAVLMVTGGVAFLRGRDWGRRAARAGAITGLAACIACAAEVVLAVLLRLNGPSTDEWLLVAGVIFVAVGAWNGFEARRLGTTRCRAWCSLRIRRSVGLSSSELAARNP